MRAGWHLEDRVRSLPRGGPPDGGRKRRAQSGATRVAAGGKGGASGGTEGETLHTAQGEAQTHGRGRGGDRSPEKSWLQGGPRLVDQRSGHPDLGARKRG